jgi:peptide deformylase
LEEAREICKGTQNGSFVTPGSKYNNCFAMAQPQVSNKPLRYFVINPITASQVAKDFSGLVVINPRILEKDKSSKVMSLEGCMSYPFRPEKKVKRYAKIKVTYSVIEDLKNPKVVHVESREIKDFTAFVCLHELEHLDGKSIFTN